MKNLKRLVIGVAFSAMLATTLLGTGSDAYAKSGAPGNTAPLSGPTAPSVGGIIRSLGVSWE